MSTPLERNREGEKDGRLQRELRIKPAVLRGRPRAPENEIGGGIGGDAAKSVKCGQNLEIRAANRHISRGWLVRTRRRLTIRGFVRERVLVYCLKFGRPVVVGQGSDSEAWTTKAGTAAGARAPAWPVRPVHVAGREQWSGWGPFPAWTTILEGRLGLEPLDVVKNPNYGHVR